MTSHEAAKLTEDEARAYLEEVRWPDGPICAHCGATERQMDLTGTAHRKGLHKCGVCRRQYSVTVNTVMHRSHISLARWVYAFHVLCEAKKGKSACELQRALGIKSYRTVWRMAHRIREAMREEPLRNLLRGEVETDECYIGGKPRHGTPKGKRVYREPKAPVLAMLSRDGMLVAKPIAAATSRILSKEMKRHIHYTATLYTDQHPAYPRIAHNFTRHETVNHSAREYARGRCHVNTAESFFAILQRAIVGTHHHVSKKYLSRYVDAAVFNWNHRKDLGTDRVEHALRGVIGKRLQYAG